MKYILTLLVLLAFVVSCGQKKEAEQKAQEQPQKVEQAKYSLADLDVNICPGCGMTFKTDADIADTAHYAGKVYGFCGPKCKDTFKADPEKTLTNMHERMEKMEGMHKEGEESEEKEEHEHSEM